MEEAYRCDECSYVQRATGSGKAEKLRKLLFQHSILAHGFGLSLVAFRQKRQSYRRSGSLGCDECGPAKVTVAFRQNLAKHLALHHQRFKHLAPSVPGRPEAVCDVCDRLFTAKSSLIKHLGREHSLGPANFARPEEAQRKKIACDDCQKMKAKNTMHFHWLFAHSSILSASRLRGLLPKAAHKELPCEDCGRRFRQSNGLWRHWASRHSGGRQLLREARPSSKVVCDHCSGRLIHRDTLFRHWRSQHL